MSLELLLTLYNKSYRGQQNFNLDDVQEYTQSELQDAEKLLSLYELRNEIYKEKNGIDNMKFKSLIKALQLYKAPNVLLHLLKVNNVFHMILTNVEFTEVITEL